MIVGHPSTLSYDPTTNTVTLVPTGPLYPSRTYEVVVEPMVTVAVSVVLAELLVVIRT